MKSLRNLPSVEQLLGSSEEMVVSFGRSLTLEALRITLDSIRSRYKSESDFVFPTTEDILIKSKLLLNSWTKPTIIPVINASGVILHTNLGRAPLSRATISAMETVSENYSNLEYDLGKGKRGSRLVHAESVLKRLTGAEAALVVNNNASAVLLTLAALSNRKRAIIARSQLVEIGGGFRVPDVMKQSGAKLVEVGTTNRVHLHDYEDAVSEPTGVVMRAHRSNFKIVGFTSEPELKDIVDIAHKAGVNVIDDLGSGSLIDTAKYGLAHEPTVQETLSVGVDVVTFSGDKLLGGPQAGLIVGRKELISKIKKHPLARAVRADKITLAGITATLLHYLVDQVDRKIPIWQMISMKPEQIKDRANAWQSDLGQGQVIESLSTVGGGSLPGESLPTYVLTLNVKSPNKFMANLRNANPPIIARTENDRILLDPRTVFPNQDETLLPIIKTLHLE